MKIGIISDIHSNFVALTSVISEMQKYHLDKIICLGDMVGYFDRPNEVINCLRVNNVLCIKGNHDKYILGELEYKYENENIYGINRHREVLTSDNIFFIQQSKNYLELNYEKINCCFSHSLKKDSEFYINSDNIDNIEGIDNYDFYFYGHTHRKKAELYGNTLVINPGSVGQQRDLDYRPSFCYLDLDKKCFKIIRVEYNVKDYIKFLKNNYYDDRLIQSLNKFK